jgi:hypothetical protein
MHINFSKLDHGDQHIALDASCKFQQNPRSRPEAMKHCDIDLSIIFQSLPRFPFINGSS